MCVQLVVVCVQLVVGVCTASSDVCTASSDVCTASSDVCIYSYVMVMCVALKDVSRETHDQSSHERDILVLHTIILIEYLHDTRGLNAGVHWF